jgi:hypothetical protein
MVRRMKKPDTWWHFFALVVFALFATIRIEPSDARVLEVGPRRALTRPSMAASVAVTGDTIQIDPGVYFDCAVWRAAHLTIEATHPGVVMTSTTCMGKGIFVINGDDTIIRGITFDHAAVPDHNGAGIRAFGARLTVEHSRFLDNENGILAAAPAHSTIRVLDSEFRGNGKCEGQCAHGIYVGPIELLEVERCTFSDTQFGHHVKSRALRTVLIGNTITDGPTGTSSYLVDIPDGGDLLMQDNTLQKGPQSSNPTTAISIGAESLKHPTNELLIRNNHFVSSLQDVTVFVRNGTTTPAILIGNRLIGNIKPLEGPGSVKP